MGWGGRQAGMQAGRQAHAGLAHSHLLRPGVQPAPAGRAGRAIPGDRHRAPRRCHKRARFCLAPAASTLALPLHASPPTVCAILPLQTNTWRAIADMGDARAYGSCASLGGVVLAVGGLQSDMQVRARGACLWAAAATRGQQARRGAARSGGGDSFAGLGLHDCAAAHMSWERPPGAQVGLWAAFPPWARPSAAVCPARARTPPPCLAADARAAV